MKKIVSVDEFFRIEDDEMFANQFYDGVNGLSVSGEDKYLNEFNNLILFPSFIACDGFASIFDQVVSPWEWPNYDSFFEEMSALSYGKLILEARLIYFSGEYLPKTNEEWNNFDSIIWADSWSEKRRRFDEIGDMIDIEYESDNVLSKMGSYFRAIYKSRHN